MRTSSRLAALLLLLAALAGAVAARQAPLAGSRVAMSSLRRLTFYDGALTAGRRTRPQEQLICHGSPCRYARPDVVTCSALGGGDWKCDADLPSNARMGRVEVSCEGWSGPDDPFVLKDSCSLTYNLLPAYPGGSSGGSSDSNVGSFLDVAFPIVFFGAVAWILYNMVRSYFQSRAAATGATPGGGRGGPGFGGPGFGPGGGGAPPPPYSKDVPGATAGAPPQQQQAQGWRPGFWTGLGLGGAAWALNRGGGGNTRGWERPGYDARERWEDEHGRFGRAAGPSRGYGGTDGGFGETRRSTGFGGTRNR